VLHTDLFRWLEKPETAKTYECQTVPAGTEEPFFIMLHGHARDMTPMAAQYFAMSARLVSHGKKVNMTFLDALFDSQHQEWRRGIRLLTSLPESAHNASDCISKL
jgi:hypothetical protein